jgi:cyclase
VVTLLPMNTFNSNRRRLLQGFAATSCLGLPLVAGAAASSLAATALNERLTLITGAGGNVVLFKCEQGLTIVDSGDSSAFTELAELMQAQGGSARLRTLFNTHWHPDHSGGNEGFKALGAHIVAHENTKLWLGADFDVPWRGQTFKPRPQQAWPDTTFYKDGVLDLGGGESAEYWHYYQAHTDGDACLYFPRDNVLVAGGLLSDGRYPITDIATGGWIGGLLNANTAMLERINDATIIVGERGPARSKADLQAQHDMLADLYEQLKDLARQGLSGREMLEKRVTADYDERWGDPTEFILETYRGMWAHTYDMGGFI